jgi:hypothetical protein
MLCHWVFPGVSKDSSAFIFNVTTSKNNSLLDPEGEGTIIFEVLRYSHSKTQHQIPDDLQSSTRVPLPSHFPQWMGSYSDHFFETHNKINFNLLPTFVCARVFVFLCVCVCTFLFVCLLVCLFGCLFVSIYTIYQSESLEVNEQLFRPIKNVTFLLHYNSQILHLRHNSIREGRNFTQLSQTNYIIISKKECTICQC